MSEAWDPQAEYTARLSRHRARAAALVANDNRYSSLRGWIALTAIAIAFSVFAFKWLPAIALAPAVAAFVYVAVRHEQNARLQPLVARAVRIYENGLRRLDGEFAFGVATGERFLDLRHLYAGDLDVLGRGSLFQLVSTARTHEGESTLASWLLAPASHAEAMDRQKAIAELRPRVDLREDLALAGEDVRAELHAEPLREWASASLPGIPAWTRWAFAVVATAVIVSLAGFFAQAWSIRAFLVLAIVVTAIQMAMRNKVAAATRGLHARARDLSVIAGLLQRIEREQVSSARLRSIEARLRTGGHTASEQIARLGRLVDRRDDAHNQFFAPFAFLTLWSPQVALAIESWRRECGPHVGEWIAAIGEFEALASLASYAYEHPSTVFPELLDGGRAFDAVDLTHPLIPESRAVPNSMTLGEEPRLLIVSGSNMSGKSTLLRAVGLNAVLAWAGAPVRAKRLRLSPLAVGASLRTVDSLQEGKSRFYAEITRIRDVIDLTGGAVPALFLLDELLSGTNSHDRRLGAEGILRTLLDRGAVGLTTTHDLALIHIADSLAPMAANVHFEDSYLGGEIHFDYRMRPGPVQRSNAIALMRSVGIEVGAASV